MKRRAVILVAIAVLLAGGLFMLVWIVPKPAHHLEGALVSFEKWSTCQDGLTDWLWTYKNDWHMTDSDIKDLLENPASFTEYFVSLHIENKTGSDIYDLRAKLSGRVKGLWFDTTSFCEDTLVMRANEAYDAKLLVIVKSKDMTQEQISDLIRRVQLEISFIKYLEKPSLWRSSRQSSLVKFLD